MTYDKEWLEYIRKQLHYRLLDCPMFLKMALCPIPTLLAGDIPFDHFLERQAAACTTWMYCKPDDQKDLEESYSQEGALLMAIYDAIIEIQDFRTEEARDQLKERIRLATEAYLAQPEQERKTYLM